MPPPKNQQQRLQRINDRLNRWGGKPVPKDELIRLCGYSERTLKEDIQYMRDAYGAPVHYDRRQKGYCYAEPFDLTAQVALSGKDLAALEAAVATLGQLSHLAPFRDLRGTVDKLERAVQFRFAKPQEEARWLQLETVPYFRGGDLIGRLLPAIRNRQAVHFRHQRFDSDQVKTHRLVPYLIKEHRNRWYVVGWQTHYHDVRVYGLDRIHPESLELGEEGVAVPDFDAEAYFRHALGVAVYLEQQPQEVVLSFTPEQGRYFRAAPFFPFAPEAVLVDSGEEFRVALTMIVNRELVYELARLGAGVRVVAPSLLVQQVTAFHREALARYPSGGNP
jgi:predicted DNA-binding transcriptional regulator YafY